MFRSQSLKIWLATRTFQLLTYTLNESIRTIRICIYRKLICLDKLLFYVAKKSPFSGEIEKGLFLQNHTVIVLCEPTISAYENLGTRILSFTKIAFGLRIPFS